VQRRALSAILGAAAKYAFSCQQAQLRNAAKIIISALGFDVNGFV
jgi:hypothetical protein